VSRRSTKCAGPDISGADDLVDLLATTTGPHVVGYWGVKRTDPATAARLGAHGLAGGPVRGRRVGFAYRGAHPPVHRLTPGNTGAAYLSVSEVAEHVVACTRAGIQAGFHVIGGRRRHHCRRRVRRGPRRWWGVAALAARHHRLEHLEMVTAEQARAAGPMGLWWVRCSRRFDAAWGRPRTACTPAGWVPNGGRR